MLLIDVALFGLIGITVWAIQMIWIPFFEAARNIFPRGMLIGGEELHNNHHTYPNSAKLPVRPREFDIG